MKKSLSILLAFAMVLTMFASVASAADDMTAQQKYDALKAQGIFAGYPDGTAGLDKEMTRAEFARVAALLLGLDLTNPPSAATFDDVPTTHWAFDTVEAGVAAGLLQGYGNGLFGDKDNVSVEEMAIVLVKALGLEIDEDATVEGAHDWAAPFVQAAVAAGLIASSSDYTADATRSQLVVSSYAAAEAAGIIAPTALEIASLNATGAKKLTVDFNSAVADASKITVTVSKGAANIALASTDGAVWSADKKSVVLTTDSKLTAGTYTVTVKAVDEGLVVKNGTKDVTVTDETIRSIEIVTASDYIAQYANSVITFKAYNQYGEQSDRPASNFQVITSSSDAPATASTSKQEITLKTDTLTKDARVALTIIAPGATAQVTKVFIVGDKPAVAKAELGDLKLADGKTRLTSGETAEILLTAYDQYGNKITDETVLRDTTTLISTNSSVIAAEPVGLDINANKNIKVETLSGVTRDTDVTITVVANGSGATTSKTITVYAPKAPSDIAFGAFSDTVAVGDGTIYLPLVITDQFGNELSKSDIAGAVGQITTYTSNGSVLKNAAIVTAPGSDQGKLAVTTDVNTGSVIVTAMINTTGKTATTTVTVQAARVPHSIVVDAKPAAKLLPGSDTTVKFKVKDQYGKDIKAADFATMTDYFVKISLSTSSGDADGVTLNVSGDKAIGDVHTKPITAKAVAGKYGTYKINANLNKVETSGNTSLSNADASTTTVKAATANDYTYEVSQLGSVYVNADTIFTKEVKVTAKDSDGNAVALPSTPSVVQSVYASNSNVAISDVVKVTGVTKGTAILTVQFKPADGVVKIATQTVTVDTAAPVAEKLTVKNATVSVDKDEVDGKKIYDATLAGAITMTDQYGTSYKDAALTTKNAFTKTSYVVTNVKGSGTVTIAADGTVGITGTVTGFTVTVVSYTNGTSASSTITMY